MRLSRINLTRHLDLGGSELPNGPGAAARRTEFIDHPEHLGLVFRQSDPTDGRARTPR